MKQKPPWGENAVMLVRADVGNKCNMQEYERFHLEPHAENHACGLFRCMFYGWREQEKGAKRNGKTT